MEGLSHDLAVRLLSKGLLRNCSREEVDDLNGAKPSPCFYRNRLENGMAFLPVLIVRCRMDKYHNWGNSDGLLELDISLHPPTNDLVDGYLETAMRVRWPVAIAIMTGCNWLAGSVGLVRARDKGRSWHLQLSREPLVHLLRTDGQLDEHTAKSHTGV